jgi:malonate-semialdehyde dehydrogenase (acetylating)/methylmalonate-semialdehyde dehydrogenase
LTVREIGHWIGGAETPGNSGRTGPVFQPATGEIQAQVAYADPAEVDAAVQAAAKAADGWRETSLVARARIMFAFRELLHRNLDEVAGSITDEHGKTLADARGEVTRGLEVVEFACGIPHLLKGEYSDQVSTGVDAFSFRQPLGVCAGITPFNFPAMVPLWMHPIAIATGNTFVLKPSERNPSASMLVAKLYAEAGLPAGVFNVLNGDKVAVESLLDHPGVSAVSFVGSTPIAKFVHARATASGKRVQALGGAKNHAVVLPDADLDTAAAELTAAGYGSAGQRCMAISVVVAVGDAADGLVERLATRAAAIKVGPGREPGSEMGPLVTAEAAARVSGYVERSDARVVVDGRGMQVPGHDGGYWVGPTLLDGVAPTSEAYTDEIFGPVLAVVRVGSFEEAVALVNANPYGNGVAIFTTSGAAARRFTREVQVGMVGINVPIPVPMAFYSFGGWKDSLFGDTHVHGAEGVRFYTRAKAVTSRWPETVSTDAALHFPTAR